MPPSWVDVVKNTNRPKKKVQWKNSVFDLGVETRVYIQDEDHEGYDYVGRHMGVRYQESGRTVTYRHCPWTPGEMKEELIFVGDQVWDRCGFSQMTYLDGEHLPKSIFGRVVCDFIEGVKDEWGIRRGRMSPDIFKTGKGKMCVDTFEIGDERIRELFEEALRTIRTGGRYGLTKEACHLESRNEYAISMLYSLYQEARVERHEIIWNQNKRKRHSE